MKRVPAAAEPLAGSATGVAEAAEASDEDEYPLLLSPWRAQLRA